ncbi:MAG: hypothetical protein ACLGSH_12030 [Acidobacteriota bacterium]
MFQYSLYGLLIDSKLALPGAPKGVRKDRDADLTILWSPLSAGRDPEVTITIPAAGPGNVAFGVAQNGFHAMLWEGKIIFLISPRADLLRVFCREETLEYVPTVLVGVALGFVLQLRNTLCLHATVLGSTGRTIAIMGDSGSGKSSAAAAFLRNGACLYSDDVAAIEFAPDGRCHVQHGCMGLRLCADSAAALLEGRYPLEAVPYLGKLLWDLSGQRLDPTPPRLDALYWLDSTDSNRGFDVSAPLPPREALAYILRSWYPPQSRHLMNSQRLEQMRRLILAVPIYIIRYEKRWDNLPLLQELFLH